MDQRQTQDHDVTEAEVETHAAIVEEYAQEITTLDADIQQLQRAMVDLAEHAHSQGETLDSIEANMSQTVDTSADAREQLVIASTHQQRGNKLIFYLLILAAVIAFAIVV